ncbi:hypothetical protein [Sphingomonas phage Birtae]|nr:hypothetical protein [Sphingomonas phage Birtae]
MTLDEALSEAVQGARVTAPHMQPGCYVEHSFSRGFLRCWPVDRPDEEPSRTQCDFRSHEGDEKAVWRILTPEEQYPPKPKVTGGWGNVPGVAKPNTQAQGRATRNPPIGEVIIIDHASPPAPEPPRVWALPKKLDPNKGGW